MRALKGLTVTLILMSFVLFSHEVFADCGHCGMGSAADKEEAGGIEIIEGEVVCLGCTLKKEKGAKAQCSIYGHTHAVRTPDGKIWTILENAESTELINNHDYEGKHIEIKGRKFADARVIEVESFKVLSEEKHAHKH